MARGMSLSRRIRHLEERWAYYLAFGSTSFLFRLLLLTFYFYLGLPSTAICTWGTGLANAAIFALIFPAV
jgi:etoposide-induced 2.4 mRNA